MSGTGRVQTEGGPVRAIRAGDTVWIPPGEKHWHGAAPENAMVHLAIHERHETQGHVAWLDEVAEADYLTVPR